MIKKLIYLPRRIAKKIGWLTERALVNAGAQNRFWTWVYYAFFNHAYITEQKTFLAGRCAYRKSKSQSESSDGELRRNVHRIEKGLIMRPRRLPFGLDYIGATVDAFVGARKTPDFDPDELKWANDVLTEYFSICLEVAPSLKPIFIRFQNSELASESESDRQIPYRRSLHQAPSVNIGDLFELAKRRRSVRWFLQKPVPREMMDKAIEVACLAPSACNRQPFQFRIFDDRNLISKVVKIPYGLVGYGHNVPCMAVLVGKQRNYYSEKDRHLIYIDTSLAAMGLLFGLEVQGLASCCVNWPEIDDNNLQMTKLLGLAPDERPVMLLAIGYPDPDGMVPRSTKKSIVTVRRYNFE